MKRTKMNLMKAAGFTVVCLWLCVITTQAATLTVTTTADAGFGSLRQAIIDATINAEANIVIFNVPTTDPGYDAAENRVTINLKSALPNIPLAPMTINSAGPQRVTVTGNFSFRVFTLVNSAVVTMTNVTISNGFSKGDIGGGIYMGNSSTLNLIGCTVNNNTADGYGGGVYMADSGTLTLTNSTVRNNSSAKGGGIYMNDSATLNMNGSTISGNRAISNGSGGGIFNGTSGTVNATNSTIDGNSADDSGGGIFNTATMTLTNSTVSSNSASQGGGIYNDFTATLNNNIVALNTASDGNDLLGRDSLGQAFTGSYNLIGDADGSEGLAGAPNQIGSSSNPLDPRIGPLRDNGGPTFTRSLHNQSPAIDKGNSPDIITDQRGETRPYDNLLIANAPGGNGSDIGSFERTFTPTPFDFDGDGKADLSVFRPDNGVWFIINSSNGMFTWHVFGLSTDRITPADFDGDGKTDIAVFRDGVWYIDASELGLSAVQFGTKGDVPVAADYDGDGKADVAVFREGTWYILNSGNSQFRSEQFGISTDKPAVGDFDGDYKSDLTVFRDGDWFIQRSQLGFIGVQFGAAGDDPVVKDYDGDNIADIAVFRNGEWYIQGSLSGFKGVQFGFASDQLVPADYDGDGKADVAVFRTGTWYVLRSSDSSFFGVQFGESGDIPAPSAYLP